jgi:hypothetical protein
VSWTLRRATRKFKIEKLGRLKKHLECWFEWKNDKVTTELYLESIMPKLIEVIIINFKKATGKESKQSSVPETPGKILKKREVQQVKLDEYRSLVGEIMYCTTKLVQELSNVARESASYLSSPGEEHWIELGKCVGNLRYGKYLNLLYR